MIIVNIAKAQTIGHTRRRILAQEYFAPYDRIIELNIPGQEQQRIEAEAQRAIIRQKDADCQAAIDAATTPEEISQALTQFVV